MVAFNSGSNWYVMPLGDLDITLNKGLRLITERGKISTTKQGSNSSGELKTNDLRDERKKEGMKRETDSVTVFLLPLGRNEG